MTEFAIRTENLGRDFGKLRALDNLSIEVPAGRIFGFLGPNGAGKTTTIRLLLGLLAPSRGQANVLGFDVHTQAGEIREVTGALLEHHGLYERLSAEDNLEFYGRVWRIPSAERARRIHTLLQSLGLESRRKEIVSEWSRGMKQKLAVARTLLHRPRLVFLDEPTAGLDPVAAAALRDDLAALAEKEGVTVFLTTHNLVEAEKLCHQVGVIRQGHLVALGAPESLRSNGRSNKVTITGQGFSEAVQLALRQRPEVVGVHLKNKHLEINLAGEAHTAPLVSLMVNSGVEIEEVVKEKASLEEVFLTLMEEEK
jgi:ABC-2 type transport system ATP-binding protein